MLAAAVDPHLSGPDGTKPRLDVGEMVGYIKQYIFNGDGSQFYLMHCKKFMLFGRPDNQSSRITEGRICEVLLYM